MIVNGIDLAKKYGNRVIWLNQTIKPRNVITYTDWLDNAHDPVKYKENKYTDFEIYIDMLVKGNTKEECEITLSSILADFDSGIIKLDNMQFQYKFNFKSENNREIVKRWLYHYEITLNGYCKMGQEETITFTGTTYKFDVKGTAETPAVLSLTSDIGLNYLTITGLTEEPITINEVQINSKLLVDGENEKITENGISITNKCYFWEFPRLLPGEANITLSSSCAATLKYYPRYK